VCRSFGLPTVSENPVFFSRTWPPVRCIEVRRSVGCAARSPNLFDQENVE
jgi:hypothetical protein